MKRLSLIALALGLTALAAWGCGSSHNGNPVDPNNDSLDNPATPPLDVATPGDEGGDNDDLTDATGQIGGTSPGQPNDADRTNGNGDADEAPARDALTMRRDCNGQMHFIDPSATKWFFQFGRDTATCSNLNRTWTVGTESGETFDVSLTAGGWNAVNPAPRTEGIFSADLAGTFTGAEADGQVKTSVQLQWSAASSTCFSIDSLEYYHEGPFGTYSDTVEFAAPLTITANRYEPVKGERYASVDPNKAQENPSYWQTEIEDVTSSFGHTYVTFTIREAETGSPNFRLMWSDDYGIVAMDDPWLDDGAGNNRSIFPGYPAR